MKGCNYALLICLSLSPIISNAGNLYKCINGDGRKIFQSTPCENTLKRTPVPPIDAGDINRATKDFLKKAPELRSPAELHQNIQSEITKSRYSSKVTGLYIITQIMEVPDKYCGKPFRKRFSDFKDFFKEELTIGKKHFELVNTSSTLEDRQRQVARLKESREKQYRRMTKESFCKWSINTLQEFQTVYFLNR